MKIHIIKLYAQVALFSLFSVNLQVATAESSATQICSSEGALGIRFGEKFSATRVQADTFLFGKDCYLVKPFTSLPYFDTYAACVSEFDGKIYQIQAAKIFDNKPVQGSSSLSAEQISSNRELGKQTLEGMLTMFPNELSTKAKVKSNGQAWELLIDDNITLEVSNYPSWSATFECRNEAMAVQVFKKRLGGR